jgi:hypothetical protein
VRFWDLGIPESIYMSGTPRSGARQDLATEVTEITEGGGLVFMLCALRCAAVAQSDALLREPVGVLSGQKRKDDDSLHAPRAGHILPAIPIIFDLMSRCDSVFL